jgi:hypothetical protein
VQEVQELREEWMEVMQVQEVRLKGQAPLVLCDLRALLDAI